ncbi:MAG TPA: A/G-specific adenine glycosylase [Desulfotignum sp.]|nr:A/G-specific adenine glycosylase [Desulfotignum sp.]
MEKKGREQMTPVKKKIPAPSQADLFSIRNNLAAWYRIHQRRLPWRENTDPYPIWVSEVMLQQTQVKTVVPYFLDFMTAFPALKDLAEADLDQVLKQWEGLGYYARARNLHKAARQVVSDLDGRIPERFSDFRALPGVGDYIASAVLSIAFGQVHAVVDGNVKRVLSRLFCLDMPVNHSSAHRQFKPAADTLLDRTDPGGFNQAVMELGALVCTPVAPECNACPLAGFCCALTAGRVQAFPVRVKPQKIPCHHISTGIVIKNGRVLITQRKPEGLLGGLWEFPGGKVDKKETAAAACLREIREETGLTVRVTSFLTRIKHAYTHFKIEMDVFFCEYVSGDLILNGPMDSRWIDPLEISRFAFPRANLKFIPLIHQNPVFQEACHGS